MIRIGTTLTAPTGALLVAIGVAALSWGNALAAASSNPIGPTCDDRRDDGAEGGKGDGG